MQKLELEFVRVTTTEPFYDPHNFNNHIFLQWVIGLVVGRHARLYCFPPLSWQFPAHWPQKRPWNSLSLDNKGPLCKTRLQALSQPACLRQLGWRLGTSTTWDWRARRDQRAKRWPVLPIPHIHHFLLEDSDGKRAEFFQRDAIPGRVLINQNEPPSHTLLQGHILQTEQKAWPVTPTEYARGPASKKRKSQAGRSIKAFVSRALQHFLIS